MQVLTTNNNVMIPCSVAFRKVITFARSINLNYAISVPNPGRWDFDHLLRCVCLKIYLIFSYLTDCIGTGLLRLDSH